MEAIDALEDGHLNFSTDFPRVSPDPLGLDDIEEALHCNVDALIFVNW